MATLALGIVENILIGGKTVSILSKVGTDIVIGTLATSTSAVGGMLTSIYSSDKPGLKEIKSQLDKIDLEHIVGVIRALINEQSNKKNIEMKDSVKKALIGVNEILVKINDELNEIHNAINKHNGKYFSSWRSFDCKCNINQIKEYRDLLDKRYKMYVELLNIYH